MEREPHFIDENEKLSKLTPEDLLEQVGFRSNEQLDKLRIQIVEAVNQGKMENEEGKKKVAKLYGEYRSDYEKQADQILENLTPENKLYHKEQIGVGIAMALLCRDIGLMEQRVEELRDAADYAMNMGAGDWAEVITGELEKIENTASDNDNPEQ